VLYYSAAWKSTKLLSPFTYTSCRILPRQKSESILCGGGIDLNLYRYCKAVYQTNPDPHGIYMLLLKLYLRPEVPALSSSPQTPYLPPALDLISRHSPRLDAVETLQLLPPLITASDVSEYLCEALRSPRIHVRLERELWKARSDQVSQQLMAFESKRVKITEGRL
jgi:hypothetical protein